MDDRPINGDDLLRSYIVLWAVRSWCHSDEPLAETLRLVYEDDPPDRPFVKKILEDPVPERVLADELRHATLVLEALWRGKTEIPDISALESPLAVCAEPRCPEFTYSTPYCVWHELGKGLDR